MRFFEQQQQAREWTRRYLVQYAIVVALGLASVFLVTSLLVAPLLNALFGGLMQRWLPGLMPRENTWAAFLEFHLWTGAVYSALIVWIGIRRRTWILRRSGDYIAKQLGSRRVSADSPDPAVRRLRNVVAEMALAAGIPQPRLYVWSTDATLNVLTVGRGPADASMFVSKLAMRALSRDELQALVAYGFSQILNGDTGLITRTAAWRQAIRWPAEVSLSLITFPADAEGNIVKTTVAYLFLILWLGLALGVVTLPQYCIAEALQRRLGNERQRLADASAVQFTRNPPAFVGALIKATALNASMLKLKRIVREFSQASFVPLPGFPTSEHLSIGVRIRFADPHISELELSQRQRAAIDQFEREEAGRLEPVEKVPDRASPMQRMQEVIAMLEVAAAMAPAIGVLALLIDREPEIQKSQLALLRATLDGARHAEVTNLLRRMQALPRRVRAALLDGYLARLRDLSVQEQRELRHLVVSLEALDDHSNVFEFAIARLTEVFLADLASTQQPHGPVALRQQPDAVELVLTVMTQFSARGEATALFVKAQETLAPIRALEFKPRLHWAAPLRTALQALDRLEPAEKGRLLDACALVAAEDGRLSDDENELLRVISASLHCPMPRVALQDT